MKCTKLLFTLTFKSRAEYFGRVFDSLYLKYTMSTFKFIFLVPLVLVLIFSCKSSKEVSGGALDESSTDSIVEIVNTPEGDEVSNKSLFASIERGSCYGRCPTYKMYIFDNGSVELEGIRAVDFIGSFTGNVTSAQMQELTDTATRIGYMELDDTYDGQITDIPGTRTSIVIDGVSKEVYRRFNYPKRILNFEKLFDEILNNSTWTAVEK